MAISSIKCMAISIDPISSYRMIFHIDSHSITPIILGITSDSMSTVYRSLQNSHTFGTLHTLNLSNNSLSTFPAQLRGLLALKKLILAGNSLGIAGKILS